MSYREQLRKYPVHIAAESHALLDSRHQFVHYGIVLSLRQHAKPSFRKAVLDSVPSDHHPSRVVYLNTSSSLEQRVKNFHHRHRSVEN